MTLMTFTLDETDFPDLDNPNLPRLTKLISDVLAKIPRVAPLLSTTTDPAIIAEAKAILRAAVLRRYDAGTGAKQIQQKTAGPFGESYTVDSRNWQSREILTDSETNELQAACSVTATAGPLFTMPTYTPIGEFQPTRLPYAPRETYR